MPRAPASVSRRAFICGAAATATTAVAPTTVAAQDGTTTTTGGGNTTTAGGATTGGNASAGGNTSAGGNASTGGSAGSSSGPIDYGGWFEGVPYWGGDGSTVDATGKEEVTITVGGEPNSNLSFQPAAVHVDPGTTIIWEWSGKGGGHNVQAESGAPASFESDIVSEEGHTFEQTLDEAGIYPYFCNPHRSQGMKGAVAVGQVPRKSTGGAASRTRTPPDPEEMGVPLRSHYVGIAALSGVAMTFIFTFYLLKYGESPHAKRGD